MTNDQVFEFVELTDEDPKKKADTPTETGLIGTIAAVATTATAVVGAITAVLNLFKTADEVKQITDKWKAKANQPKQYYQYKPISVSSSAKLDVTVHDVDDDANIWWNGNFLYTHSIKDGPRKIRIPLRGGQNIFHFELNNHGRGGFSLYALIEQNGRRIAHLRLKGKEDDRGSLHIAVAPITAS